MQYRSLFRLCGLLMLIVPGMLPAQSADLAYVNGGAREKSTLDPTMHFAEDAPPGAVTLALPDEVYAVDILNARGTLVRQIAGEGLVELKLDDLRPGTWTLRAHTNNGFQVRRFVVLQNAGVLWAGPDPRLRRRR